jgi:aryl-alcohol dehydrogenase-like predicted oxidoreductase
MLLVAWHLTMKQQRFGRTEMLTSALGLGCARIGGIFQNDAAGFVRLLHAARDAGITFFDTADMYSQGESETLLGRAFHGRRHEIVIASKVGYCLPARRRWIARVKPIVRPLIQVLRLRRDRLPSAVRGQLQQDFSPGYIRGAVDGSLRRLRTDYLDLLQLHSPERDVIARGEWAEALESLKWAGKIRHYGISCDTVEAADAALAYSAVASIQVAIHLLDRQYVQSILPLASQLGVAVIARECLANGVLVKGPHDLDAAKYWSTQEECERKLADLRVLRAEAQARGVQLARYALDYVTGLPGVSVSLVGVSNLSQLSNTLRMYRAEPSA